MSEIASLHAEPSIDTVIVVPHWGIENSTVWSGDGGILPNLPLRLARWRWLAPTRTRFSGGNA
jgi:hypothetical protein